MSKDVDYDDINFPSIEALVKARLPIVIPWSKLCEDVAPGAFFHSRLASSGSNEPWSKISPFRQSLDADKDNGIHSIPMVYTPSSGATGTFKSSATSSAIETNEHLTVGLKVSVDALIVTASVKGQYDKHVQENEDVSQKLGTVMMSLEPIES
ncbi:hypothetical protein QFC19_002334 [Naganishia cerealis]|uniref:Uncharacterized protein n=1 Tax=Naganishia cerealis TaxID=610337 RepID=A0ACC2WC05_9TREE|nr:hypothetical protein QFC19_002334 [Naganishia cerealis]